MTKKHFVALARILADTRADISTIERIADLCASMNPRFDRDRFIMASTSLEIEEDRGCCGYAHCKACPCGAACDEARGRVFAADDGQDDDSDDQTSVLYSEKYGNDMRLKVTP